MKSWHLNRRTVLRGAGVSLALPFMNAMAIKKEANVIENLPARAAFIFFPNGASMPPKKNHQFNDWNFFPKGSGRNYTFRKSLEPLNPYREFISPIQGLSHPSNRSSEPHFVPSAFLTGKQIDYSTTANSISIDQEIARRLGRKTQLSSLTLSTVGGVGSIRRSYTMSYDSRGQGIAALSNLRDIYKKMYLSNSKEALANLDKRERLLNSVYADAKDLNKKLGKEDSETLDEYLTSITELEKKVENDRYWSTRISPVKPPEMNLEITKNDVENYIQSIYELIFLAFKTDITRLATYQIASEGGGSPAVSLSKDIGMSKDLHSLSHGSTKGQEGFKDWAMWDQFLAKQLAVLIERLKNSKEGDGCLLDRCLVFQGAATSQVHVNKNYPLLLAGGKKIGHNAGRFVTYKEEENALSDLYVRIANCMGAPIEKFSDSLGNQMTELFS